VSRRLFVALEPPAAVREEARRAGDHLRRAVPHLQARFADPEAAHLTLVFLGRVDEAAVPAVVRAVEGVARTSRRFTARTAGLGAFPTTARPSVLWLGLEDGASSGLPPLHTGLTDALAGTAALERKRFVPHLTLARVRTLRGVDRSQVGDALAAFEPAAAAWPVDEVVLFESELRPDGARHMRLLTAQLGQPGRDREDAGR